MTGRHVMTRILTTSKTFLLLLPCLLLPLPLDAQGQSPPWRIAYEFCSPWAGPSGYETVCQMMVYDDQSRVTAVLVRWDVLGRQRRNPPQDEQRELFGDQRHTFRAPLHAGG